MSANFDLNNRPPYDDVIQTLANYVLEHEVTSEEAMQTAELCLIDSLGCGFRALAFPECTKMLGPWTEGTTVARGVRVPGTHHVLDRIKGAWDIGCLIRWLDFNDTWLAAEWGHPSDNLGAILAIADSLSQEENRPPLSVRDVLHSMVLAHEIQGVLALENSFNRVGLDHVLLVRVASTAIAARMMGANREQTLSAISHAWVDGSSLRTYRHAPNAGSRKSWAAGDATSRGVLLATIAMKNEMGIPGALTAPTWGFYDVAFSHNSQDGQLKPAEERTIRFQRELGSYVMENILFKLSFPAEFHSQTACEAAVRLHPQVSNRIRDIQRIEISTHESAIRIISKQGPLANPADRDHCLQYMVAVPLLTGGLTAENYEDDFHRSHPEIDILREKMTVIEHPSYSLDYHDPQKRSIANALQVFFTDGSSTERVEIEYPIGHRRRRQEGIPVLKDKFTDSVQQAFGTSQANSILELSLDSPRFQATSVHHLMGMLSLT